MMTDSPTALPFGQLIENGQAGTKRRDSVGYFGERHCLVLGSNGSGKTARLLQTALLHSDNSRSFIVIDPKGELFAVTHAHRAKCGLTHVINSSGVLTDRKEYQQTAQGQGFNPFLGLDPAAPNFNRRVGLLAAACIPIEGTQPYFPKMARTLLSALIMWEVSEAKAAGRVPSFGRVRDMLTSPAGLPPLLGKIASSGHRGMANKARPLLQESKSIRDVISELAGNTEWLDDDEMVTDLLKPGLDFSIVKKQATTVYVIIDAEGMQRYTKWLRLVISAALIACMKPRERGDVPVTFMLEEYFLIANGGLEVIDDNMAFIRGFGIQLLPVLQDLNQLQDLYPKRWETYLSNAGVIAHVGAPNDLTTAEWMTKRAGDTTEFTQSVNDHNGQGLSPDHEGNFRASFNQGGGVSYSQTRVPFLNMHDLLNTPEGVVYVWKQGLANTIRTFAPFYTDSPLGLKNRALPNPYFNG